MVQDLTPASWITGLSEDGTDITIPIASIPELTAEEADGASGDIRKVVYALLEVLYAEWEATEEADRPVNMIISRTENINPTNATKTYEYKVRIVVDLGVTDVADEPA